MPNLKSVVGTMNVAMNLISSYEMLYVQSCPEFNNHDRSVEKFDVYPFFYKSFSCVSYR